MRELRNNQSLGLLQLSGFQAFTIRYQSGSHKRLCIDRKASTTGRQPVNFVTDGNVDVISHDFRS